MTVMPRMLNADELWQMPNLPRCELVKGELIMMSPGGFYHGAIIDNLEFLLTKHVREHKLGRVVGAETGFLLSRNPDTVRGADIAFVSAARLPVGEQPAGYFPGAPDLAVEVMSPGDTLAEVEDKVDDYLNAGARNVWVVNPRRRTVTIHAPGVPPVMLREAEMLEGGDVVPGFKCLVSEIFI